MNQHRTILLAILSTSTGFLAARTYKYRKALAQANKTIAEANEVNESVVKAGLYLVSILGREGIELTEFDYLAIEVIQQRSTETPN